MFQHLVRRSTEGVEDIHQLRSPHRCISNDDQVDATDTLVSKAEWAAYRYCKHRQGFQHDLVLVSIHITCQSPAIDCDLCQSR